MTGFLGSHGSAPPLQQIPPLFLSFYLPKMFLDMNGPLCAWGRRNAYVLEWRGILKGSSGSFFHKMVSFQGVMEILRPFGACLSTSLIAFFFLLIMMPKMALGEFRVIGPAGPIQASLGGEAELPCYLSPPQSAQHMEVIWLQSTQMVHLYQDGEDHFGDQAPDYQGRTELMRDAITSGNVTLKIRDVRLLDAGKYTCLIADGFYQEQADVELKVLGEEPESPTVLPEPFIFIYSIFSVSYLGLFCYILHSQVSCIRSLSRPCEVNGILTVTLAFEVEVILCYLWVLDRCIGYVHQKESLSFGKSSWILFLLLTLRIVSVITLECLSSHRMSLLSRQ
ncbi:myelin-oligodendrocyte glycoprotein-like [Trichosurus vulpecula]|uniref:myelin-oligodendrocyte glycoprotein-like n=1 Tax=Trichosurus vulpecula TaxID=9337 RepID=UPI00186B3E25|nr:myelin-oligodendrocyte glycoprotein-like [Trichosurus vulpecula]XP_036593857.1 myelin-oligodendrocyte glycoprotein-like [Trichosurus vulpecula]